ncbi:cytochrome c oxidase subunit NDUFA4 [Neodiprion pinetum]|uniref:Cytochrome c oxidase subunit NDUFA4 n=1 Tax=Neodiprion lecontei TaxID=441921 RepID=A0A6J0C5E8_NEOLC|nr:cytochrome c oxidase subunit NDUFA4 [Neodiprion lecontei]XP_046435695.1 cytochrome c oxidase subunit NDUFA4 [Neodiprion fabricii]XP_046492733.1 cytochrome c oxidase subunit NDUFA4 [Neodiprion pinetum]XP_046629737.1 cytochrome c oxidase subunit NDUFA4 [Neodiprion virginianus]
MAPRMQGMTIASLKKHPALIPLYAFTFLGCGGAFLYTIRLAVRSPEVSWSKTKNPEPWNEFADKQHKFYSPLDTSGKIECPAPKY